VPFTSAARLAGIASASGVVLLLIAYACVLVSGFLSLEYPDDPIADPFFTILEMLILFLTVPMVVLAVAVHAWAPDNAKIFSVVSAMFTGLLAGTTAIVHFSVLTLSREPALAGIADAMFAFRWPSLAYTLDILAWDIFFALAMVFAAPVFSGSRLAHAIRGAMIASGILALAGLSGVVTGDMQLRNIGIAGYVGGYLVVAVLLAVLFRRTEPVPPTDIDTPRHRR
jgi:hypothetical protein